MAAREKAQDEKNLKILRELASSPSNKYCFDCQQRGPTYVNVTVGSFVCTTCSGLLRGLHPPHRVKSITMTSFTADEMELIKTRGNEYCKQVWLGKYDPTSSIENEWQNPSKLKEFLIQKYEDKKYYVEPEFAVKKPKARAPSIPVSVVSQSRSQTVIQTSSSNQMVQKQSWSSQNFSSGDTSIESSAFKDFKTEPAVKQAVSSDAAVDDSSFADFGSAFATSSSSQVQDFKNPATATTSSQLAAAGKSGMKKPAPPPPDRYAALADLDNQLHQQQTVPATVPTVVDPLSSAALIWPGGPPAVGPLPFNSGAPNPFGPTMPTWSQGQIISANPFQGMPQPMHGVIAKPQFAQFPVTMMTNGNSGEHNLPKNGTVTDSFWSANSSQSWAVPFPSGQVEAFTNKYPTSVDPYNPWAQNLVPDSANPFTNAASTSTSVPQKSATNNPFL